MDVLVPIDGSDCSTRALRFAAEFARRYEATLHVVHVSAERDERVRDLLAEAEKTLSAEDVAFDAAVVSGDAGGLKPADRVGAKILDLVDERDFDHVVMGHHGVGRVEELILGSTAERVVRDAPVPVTVIP